MRADVGGLREFIVVFALAAIGLLLAAAAAFAPWEVGAATAPLVGVQTPAGTVPAG